MYTKEQVEEIVKESVKKATSEIFSKMKDMNKEVLANVVNGFIKSVPPDLKDTGVYMALKVALTAVQAEYGKSLDKSQCIVATSKEETEFYSTMIDGMGDIKVL